MERSCYQKRADQPNSGMPTEYFNSLLMRHYCVWLATMLSLLIIVGNPHDAGAGSKPSLELTRHLTGIANSYSNTRAMLNANES